MTNAEWIDIKIKNAEQFFAEHIIISAFITAVIIAIIIALFFLFAPILFMVAIILVAVVCAVFIDILIEWGKMEHIDKKKGGKNAASACIQ